MSEGPARPQKSSPVEGLELVKAADLHADFENFRHDEMDKRLKVVCNELQVLQVLIIVVPVLLFVMAIRYPVVFINFVNDWTGKTALGLVALILAVMMGKSEVLEEESVALSQKLKALDAKWEADRERLEAVRVSRTDSWSGSWRTRSTKNSTELIAIPQKEASCLLYIFSQYPQIVYMGYLLWRKMLIMQLSSFGTWERALPSCLVSKTMAEIAARGMGALGSLSYLKTGDCLPGSDYLKVRYPYLSDARLRPSSFAIPDQAEHGSRFATFLKYAVASNQVDLVVNVINHFNISLDDTFEVGPNLPLSPLVLAAWCGNLTMVEWLLRVSEHRDKETGQTGLTYPHARGCAVIGVCRNRSVRVNKNRVAIIKALLKGANATDATTILNVVDKKGRSALFESVIKKGCGADVAELLIDSGADMELGLIEDDPMARGPHNNTDNNGAKPLHMCVDYDNEAIARILLARKCNPDGLDKILRTPLYHAACNNKPNLVKLLLEAGRANPNLAEVNGWTPLCIAAHAGHTEVLSILLKFGAKTEKPVGRKRHTALHCAVGMGHTQAVRILVEEGKADLSAEHVGFTPLHTAVRNGQPAVVEVLLELGAPVEVASSDGSTPLHIAAALNNPQCATLLLEKGRAPLELKDAEGATPLSVAWAAINNNQVAAVLQDYSPPGFNHPTGAEGGNAVPDHNKNENQKKLTKEESPKEVAAATPFDLKTLVSEVICFLGMGSIMVKHGRHGQPHERKFWVNKSTRELSWIDPEAPPDESKKPQKSVALSDVTSIVLGPFSGVFRRNPPSIADSNYWRCFTLTTRDSSRPSLDIVAPTLHDFEAWVLGLAHLCHIDPHWGMNLDMNLIKEKPQSALSVEEMKLCETTHLRPADFVKIRENVTHHRDEVNKRIRLNGGDWQVNPKGAVLMTKGKLRHYNAASPEVDIFRVCKLWKFFAAKHLIFDPSFTPMTNFGINRLAEEEKREEADHVVPALVSHLDAPTEEKKDTPEKEAKKEKHATTPPAGSTTSFNGQDTDTSDTTDDDLDWAAIGIIFVIVLSVVVAGAVIAIVPQLEEWSVVSRMVITGIGIGVISTAGIVWSHLAEEE